MFGSKLDLDIGYSILNLQPRLKLSTSDLCLPSDYRTGVSVN